MSEEAPTRRPNRKRKKSFLKNARKYAKKGRYGRGSHIEADLYQYFLRIMDEAKNQDFNNPNEDKTILINNVFEQISNQEIDVCCNQVGCRVIEMFLPHCEDEIFKRYMKLFGDDLRPLAGDAYASHVLETLLKTACQRDEECKEFVVKVSKFLLNNLEDYIWDNYGNHVMRTCLDCLVKLNNNELVQEYAQRLISWPQFNELCHSDLTSGFLQKLMKSLHQIDEKLFKKYFKKIFDQVFKTENDNEHLPKAFLSTSVLMLLETTLELSTEKMFKKIYKNLFEDHLKNLTTLRSTNFAIQKLLQYCTDKTLFENIFDKIIDLLDLIIEKNHTGIILNLAKRCGALNTKQGNFVQSLIKSLRCTEDENELILCLCRMKPYDKNNLISNENLHKEKLNIHGTLTLQTILDYNKPIKIVNAILNLNEEDLKKLLSNTMGCHITDSYVKARFVGHKSIEKLIKKMSGTYQDLASNKYGSRSFEALWQHANFKLKLMIMDEMTRKDNIWCNGDYGKIIAGKINLVLYKRSKENWKEWLEKKDEDDGGKKSEKFLAEILK